MARLSVADAVAVCKPTYRSIDMRVAAYNGGDRWNCAYAAVRLSSESLTETRSRLEQHRRQLGPLRTDHFAVSTYALPFREWANLCTQFAMGVLKVGEMKVHLQSAASILSEANYLRTAQQPSHSLAWSPWPSLDITRGQNPGGPLNAEHITKAIGAAGYASAFQAIAAFCEVKTWPDQGYGHNVFIQIPIFAVLTSVRFDPVKSRLSVAMRLHRKLRTVVLRSLFSVGQSSVPHNRIEIDFHEEDPPTQGIAAFSGFVQVLPSASTGSVEISLSHPALGELERQRYGLEELLPAAQRNPLFETFKYFCPHSTLEQMLTRPGNQKAGKSDQSVAFEQHVSWLLSLLGFSPIVLGQHEHLKSDRTHLGSIDVIAFGERRLLLVACTVAAPKTDDFANLWHLHRLVVDEILAGTTTLIIPIVVTGVTSSDTYSSGSNGVGTIAILDVHRLRTLVQSLPTEAVGAFLSFISDPRASGTE